MLERVALVLFACLSAIGLAYGTAVNLWTFTADPPASAFPGFLALHVGMLPICGGAVLLAAWRLRKSRSTEWSESVFRRVPIALRALTLGIGLYALGLAIEQKLLGGGAPANLAGRYVLHDDGEIVKELTAEEYRVEEAGVARRVSAFHMTFYAISLAMTIGCLRATTPTAAGTDKTPIAPSESPAIASSPTIAKETSPDRPAGKSRPAWRVD